LGPDMGKTETAELVARCATLAALLEVSAYPKPGNVHRTRDFPGTRYEHFLAGSVTLANAMRELAKQGFEAERALIGWCDIDVGVLALEAVTDTLSWQRGGNVNLGAVLLFAPIAAAGGAALQGEKRVEAKRLRESLRKVIECTTPEDSLAVYKAIRMAMTPRVLGEVDDLDVHDDSALNRIRDEGLTLKDVFRRCADRDSICGEWVTDFETTFEVGYPYLNKSLESSEDINSAVVDTFLFILSGHPDSLIRRKSGLERAEEVSRRAKMILDEGGSRSEKGREMLQRLDRELQEAGGDLNPGTTADLMAASIFVALLGGWRP
jgi:triphosphoribosyl-dephospho-CoA synthase